jgi:hypothetical protein
VVATDHVNLNVDNASSSDNHGNLDTGVFAVPSLTSIYEPPSEQDKLKSFGTV